MNGRVVVLFVEILRNCAEYKVKKRVNSLKCVELQTLLCGLRNQGR